MRAHVLVTLAVVLSRAVFDLAGLELQFSLDWMWLSDPADLRGRLFETLYYFHAFPPGMNLLTGILLKLAAAPPMAAHLAHALFWMLGLVFVNALLFVGRAAGLSTRVAFGLALAFALTPASIYFEHLYLYEWPITTLLCLASALFYHGVRRPSFGVWLACFSVCAAMAWTRSTFHLVWFASLVAVAIALSPRGTRRLAGGAATAPAAVVLALYAKNAVLFGAFAASTFGPASYTLVTVAQLPTHVRDAQIAEGALSPFAAISVYAPPREYARFFSTSEHPGWPPQLTRLERSTVNAPNFNHWWLLEVHRARRGGVMHYLRTRPLEYGATVLEGLVDMFGPSTTWHPRDSTPASPHYRHRQVLGGYEAWFNRVMHGVPVWPVGLYVFLPVPLIWAVRRAWWLHRQPDPAARARGALIALCVFHIVYVVAVSTMLTYLESARYRYQIEWMIWLITVMFVTSAWQWLSRRVAWRWAEDRAKLPR